MADATYRRAEIPPLNEPNIAGYAFVGWYWDAACTDAIDTASLTGTIMYNKAMAADKSITVYGKYKEVNENEVKIVYNVDSSLATVVGDLISTPAQVTVDKTKVTSYTLTSLAANDSNILKRYYFDGWYSDPNYTTKVTAVNTADAVDGLVNVYGKWKQKYVVTVAAPTIYDSPNTATGTVKVGSSTVVTVNSSMITSTEFYVTPGTSVVISANCSGKKSSYMLVGSSYAACKVTIDAGGQSNSGTASKKNWSENNASANLTCTVNGNITINITFDGST